MMKCYMKNCVNNNEWACWYRDDCDDCSRDCKNYYQCISCDYYMDEDIEQNNFEVQHIIEDINTLYEPIPEEYKDRNIDDPMIKEKIQAYDELANLNWQKDIMCNEVPFQTYECCYHIYLPWKSWEDDDKKFYQKMVSIDKCLLPEILSLWEMGIKTTGCCCGHGRQKPFIGVTEDNIQRMKNLGYEVQFNSCRPEAEDSFIPKTELNYGKSKCTEV